LEVVNVHRDEIRLIVPGKHPLAGRSFICCQDLLEYPLLLPKSGITRARLNAWFETVEDKIQVSMELDSTEMMKRFVMAGLGVSFLAVSNCQEEIAAGKLKTLALAPEPMVRRLGLIYRRDKALSKAALGFIQIILDNMGEHRSEKKMPKLATG
jgi:DNA-binding transcriptional LysR family regulator